MLYVFHGTEINQSREKAHKLIDSLRAKKPDAAYETMTAESWNESVIEGHLGGQGLFSNKYIVFLDRLTENDEVKEKLGEFIPALAESPNIFIVLEGKLLADLKKSFEKHAEKVVVTDKVVEKSFGGGGGFNIFALADAVGSRDALKSWTIYRQAVDNGHESESILGTIFWQVKSMALARDATSAASAGLSPFVFTKAKRAAGNYSREELARLSTDLITIYHDGHRGMRDLELATEKLLLSLT